MLSKIFGNNKSSDIPKVSTQGRHVIALAGSGQRQSRALKIVRAGGHVERYYMATPAAMIIQKNPSFVLARPEIFRRPWDSDSEETHASDQKAKGNGPGLHINRESLSEQPVVLHRDSSEARDKIQDPKLAC
ncbi:hypothetical protein SASPL_124475 [Salvia splendens]|uniref:Uncharacterized protein n=1 Tax=Salvia splendens TaxID=180675 RepID=A0A8X8XQ32_SALSN|nr:hypothetical protein SASPL_124475 [Salvia splendens]